MIHGSPPKPARRPSLRGGALRSSWAVNESIVLAEEGRPDILIWDRFVHVGAPGVAVPMQGGSELYAVMLATELAKRGHKVALTHKGGTFEADGVWYVALPEVSRNWARWWPTKALCVQRGHAIGVMMPALPPTVSILAHDVYSPWYDVHRPVLENGRARLICNSTWQSNGFRCAKDNRVVYPMVMLAPAVAKVPGRFVYASSAIKGLDPSRARWRDFCKRHPDAMRGKSLIIVTHPGWCDQDKRHLAQGDERAGISFVVAQDAASYRQLVASAEGTFFVNTYHETWCNLAVIAEQARTRTHILCKAGFGGIAEALSDMSLVTDSDSKFERDFFAHLGKPPSTRPLVDRSPAGVVASWEDALGLSSECGCAVARRSW